MQELDKIKYEQLIQSIRTKDPEIIADGPVDWSRYVKSKIRILWILRETNGGGDWDLREFLTNPFSYKNWHSTFGAVAKISHCFLNDLSPEELNFNARSVADSLKDIAVINVNKKGGASHIDNNYYKNLKAFINDVKSQIQILKPKIIIAAGTLDQLAMFDDHKEKLNSMPISAIKLTKKQWLVKSYHTAQRSITVRKMYEMMLLSLEKADWKKSTNNANSADAKNRTAD
ncbi:hypothetical protein QUF90_12975 [Desulfococcaceae bacterium HSG9]|nr:hypothetical protein [Desulfococcaceae bacterium HSG9]